MKTKMMFLIFGIMFTFLRGHAEPLWSSKGSAAAVKIFAQTSKVSKPLTKRQLVAALGNEGAHGGDPYALEFVALGEIILNSLREGSLEQREITLDLQKFEDKLQTTLVYSAESEKVILNGVEVSAINREDYILLNATRWRTMLLAEKMRLVMHEYLGILNVERDVYRVSEDFYMQLNTLAKNLIDAGNSPGQYYGVCQAGLGLLETEMTCDKSSSMVKKLNACAEHQALLRCKAELGNGCRRVGHFLEQKINPLSGMASCQVISIAK